jgi:hypothetical protein
MNNIIEKYSELKEELDGKNPLMKYALLREELDNKDPLKRYAQIKEELDYIKEENARKFEEDKKKREEDTLEVMESLFHSLGGEESDIENQPIIADEQPQELISEEEVEKVDIQEEQPINGFKSVIDVISKQEARKEKLQEQPNDPVSARIEKLEKWIQKISIAGPGSGEVRLLNLDDVNTTDLANNKILKYQSSSGKFIFADAATGSGHTIQNAGSDLTARDNLNFDGTYVIATDDSSNDQTDITLHASLLGSTSATGTTLADADRVVVNDNGTMKQVALTDFETYFESALDTTSNITTVGALDSGSITSGFGTIDTGSSTITTTGLISGGSLDIDNVLINGTTIGHTDDTDLITVADGKVTVAGELQATTLDIGGTNITSTAAELNLLDGSSAGTVVNSKGVIYSGTGTVAGTLSTAAQGNITSLGTLTTLTVDNIIINGTNIGHTNDTDAIAIASSGNVTISQDLAVSGALTISGGTTKIESTVTTIVDPIIHLQTASGGGVLGSDTNKDVGLALQYHTGSAAKTAFLGYDDSAGKLTFIPDATLSSEVVSGTAGTIVAALEGTVTGDVTGNADTATALATGRTIGMTGDVVWTSASFTGSGNVTGSATIQAGSVENSMLADDAVGADELASDAVVNASVASGAAIALSKLATTTASRVLETSGTGAISASDITTTELAFLDGSTAGSVVNSKAVIYSGTGTIAGTLSTAAQGNVTSLGTLTTLTVDNVIINGTTIGHTDDTDLMTLADGILTVAGRVDAAADIKTDAIRRYSDSSTTTKILLNDEVIKLNAGHASNEVVNIASGIVTVTGEVSMTTLDIGGTNVTSTAAELNRLDGIGSAVVGLTDSQTMTNKTLTSPVINTGVSGTAVLDEDNMTSNSATKIATQQSIKAYTDATSTAMAIALG